MTKKEQAFVILMEECGELIQACSKMIRSGGETKYERNLQDEVGDVLTLIEVLKISGQIPTIYQSLASNQSPSLVPV